MTVLFVLEKYSHVKKIIEHYDSNIQKDNWGNSKGYVIQLSNKYVFVPCVGCMHLLNNMYTLINEYTIDCVVRIGTCGIISADLSLGQVVLAERSINKDVLSEKYFPNDTPFVSPNLSQKLKEVLDISSITACTIDVLWEKPDERADVVDMETSALYCYGNHNNVECASVSVCRDNKFGRLSKEKTEIILGETVQTIIRMLEGV